VTYSISGGNDASLFTIDGATGGLSFLSAPDYETPLDTGANNVYEVEVTANDNAGNTTPQLISVTVYNVNESTISATSDVDVAVDAVSENAVAGNSVGITVYATDTDTVDSVSYSLDDDASGQFAIDSVTGVVTTTGPLDAELASSHSVVVRATSTDGSSSTQAFTINVIDQNDSLPVIATNTLSIVRGDTVLLNNSVLHSTDQDITPGTLTYTVTGVLGGRFELVANPGVAVTSFTQTQVDAGMVVFVDDGDAVGPAYDVTVSDGVNSTGPQAATINFTNSNNAPVAGDVAFELTTSLLTSTIASTVTDAEGDPLTFLIVAGPEHGTLDLASDGTFSYSPDSGFFGNDSFTFRATDGTTLSNSATVTITVVSAFIPPPDPVPETEAPVEDVTEPEETSEDTQDDEDVVRVLGTLPESDSTMVLASDSHPGSVNAPADLLDIIPKSETESVLLALRTRDDFHVQDWHQRAAGDISRAESRIFRQPQRYDRSETAASPNLFALTRSSRLWQELDSFQQDLQSELNFSTITIGSVGTVASGLTVGYVLWAVRSGLLLSSVVASMPAWTMFDPFVVISDTLTADEGEEESLEDIVENQAALAASRSQIGAGTERIS
jgi:hypothetical protein